MFAEKEGTIKLIDFGLAQQMDAPERAMAGTPYYIAPEVIDEEYG